MSGRIPDIESGAAQEAEQQLLSEDGARREFLKKAGKFAVVTPPAITLLLGTSLGSEAIAASSGGGPRRGRGGGKKGPKHGKPKGPKWFDGGFGHR